MNQRRAGLTTVSSTTAILNQLLFKGVVAIRMADTALHFAVFWAGSNKQIALDLVICHGRKNAFASAVELQRHVAELVNVQLYESIKVTLGSPAGPPLTPALRSYNTALLNLKLEEAPAYKAMVAAWTSLEPSQKSNVFVTRHSHTALGIHELLRLYRAQKSRDWAFLIPSEYDRLPQTLQCNPVVAFVAIDLAEYYSVELPPKLRSSSKFALTVIREVTSPDKSILSRFAPAVRNDEAVVLAAVARLEHELLHVSTELRASKTFALKAASVNGLCVLYLARTLQEDKEVALAAVRQNRKAVKYLCAELIEDKDIQQACTSNSES